MTVIKRSILLVQFVTVPDTNSLIVNIKCMDIKVTVRINLKRPNHKYPSCHPVGRHLTFPVTITRYIPWVEFVFPVFEIWPDIIYAMCFETIVIIFRQANNNYLTASYE